MESGADRCHHQSLLTRSRILGGARFPPTVWPAQEDIDKAYARWTELGLGKPKARYNLSSRTAQGKADYF